MSGLPCIECGAFDDCNCAADPGPECRHCEVPIDEATCFETGSAFLACSVRCALALDTFGHEEKCEHPTCTDGAPLTLPVMLCAFCRAETADGATAHVSCRKRVRNAIAGEATALSAFGAFGREGRS